MAPGPEYERTLPDFLFRHHHTRVMESHDELLAASEHIHTTSVTDTAFGSIVNTSVDGHMLFKRIDTIVAERGTTAELFFRERPNEALLHYSELEKQYARLIELLKLSDAVRRDNKTEWESHKAFMHKVIKDQQDRAENDELRLRSELALISSAKDEALRHVQQTCSVAMAVKDEAFKMMQEEHKLSLAAKEETFNAMQEKHEIHLAAKDSTMKLMQEKYESTVSAKDEILKLMAQTHDAEQLELRTRLAIANTEVLKLAHSLSVRGMLEKIEYQYSEKRQREGKDATRRAVWAEIFNDCNVFKQAAAKTCSGRNIASKIESAVSIVLGIYDRRSDEIHNAGYDEIPVKLDAYHGLELDMLRNICAIAHYNIKEY